MSDNKSSPAMVREKQHNDLFKFQAVERNLGLTQGVR